MSMKVVCAWCQKTIQEGPEAEAEVSHGICEECARRVRGAGAKSMAEFIRTVGIPVMVLDGDFKVVDMNDLAENALGTTRADSQGSSVGTTISCQSAGLPGGCGNSETCPGCQLRRHLLATYADAQPRFSQVSRHELATDGAPRSLQIRFSTGKIGGVVLLLLEDVAKAGAAS